MTAPDDYPGTDLWPLAVCYLVGVLTGALLVLIVATAVR